MLAVDVGMSVASSFAEIPAVEQVYVNHSGDRCAVITIINNEDDATYNHLYDRERSIIRSHQSLLFDFRIIARRGRPVHEITGGATPAWNRATATSTCHSVTNT
jgi:hypothetical protein